MVKKMQEKFKKYWAEYYLILSCVAILDPRYKLNYVQYCFTTIYGTPALNFVQTVLTNFKLLFDEYFKNSKFTYSSLADSSNVSDNDPIDFSLHQLNINRANLGGDYDESDGYKRYLSVSNTKSEKSQLDLYLKEPELELSSQIYVL
ncbi:hypothetical protein Gohar_004532, partial [Gossypium harknessii]|nr:hypothetical protein [Gossypium harknessii]